MGYFQFMLCNIVFGLEKMIKQIKSNKNLVELCCAGIIWTFLRGLVMLRKHAMKLFKLVEFCCNIYNSVTECEKPLTLQYVINLIVNTE